MNLTNLTRALLCPVLLSLSWTAASAADRSFDKHIQAPNGGRLSVDLDLGSVDITGSDTHEVAVHAQFSGSDERISRITVHMERNGTGIELRERYDRGSSLLGWLMEGNSPRAHFIIEVPRDYPIEIKTSGGSLELKSLHAGVNASTNGGSITVRDIEGTLNAHTMGGHISAEHLHGHTELVTMGGPIEARDVRGDLEARTMGGRIALEDIDGRVSAHTSGGGVTAEELGDHDVTLETAGGGIQLTLPVTVHASIDASTLGGSVHNSLPMSIESSGQSYLKGTLNGAGHLIRLRTSGGGISIEPRR